MAVFSVSCGVSAKAASTGVRRGAGSFWSRGAGGEGHIALNMKHGSAKVDYCQGIVL